MPNDHPMFNFDEEHLRFSSTDSHHLLEKIPSSSNRSIPTISISSSGKLIEPQRIPLDNVFHEDEVIVSIQEFTAKDAPQESNGKRIGPHDFERIKVVGKGAYGKVS